MTVPTWRPWRPGWRQPSWLRSWLTYVVLVAAAFAVLQLWLAPGQPHSDTINYASKALEFTGAEPTDARRRAIAAHCADRARFADRSGDTADMPINGELISPFAVDECERKWTQVFVDGDRLGSERYLEIFSSRVGYPLLSAPSVALFGPSTGLWLIAMLSTVVAGLALAAVVRLLGGSLFATVATQVLFYVFPTGFWGTQQLAEGTTLLLTVSALLGAVLAWRGKRWWGLGLVVASVLAGMTVKYSHFLLTAAALCGAGLLLLALHGLRRVMCTVYSGRTTTTVNDAPGLGRLGDARDLVAVGAVLVLVQLAVARLAGWPGAEESLQDTFTDHFSMPDVPDPWQRLYAANEEFWRWWLVDAVQHPMFLVGLLVGLWALARMTGGFAVVVASVAAVGFATVAAHPTLTQVDRLLIPSWLLVAIGVPLLVDHWTQQRAGISRL